MEPSKFSIFGNLESRISQLEKSVYGDLDKDVIYPKCTDKLYNIHNSISSIASSNNAVEKCFTHLNSLNSDMNTGHLDELALDQNDKAVIILSQEENLKKTADLLEKINSLKDSLNSEHMKYVPQLWDKCNGLNSIHLTLQDALAELSNEIKELKASYAVTTSLLLKQLSLWDQTLRQLEGST